MQKKEENEGKGIEIERILPQFDLACDTTGKRACTCVPRCNSAQKKYLAGQVGAHT